MTEHQPGATYLTCPKCRSLVEGRDPVCPECGEVLAEKRKKTRGWILRLRRRLILLVVAAVLLGGGGYIAWRAFRTSKGDRLSEDRTLAARRLREGAFEEAAVVFRRILAAAPRNAEAAIGLAASLEATGRGGEATAILEKLVEKSPGNARAQAMLARRLVAAGEFPLARVHALRALDLDPEVPAAHYAAGVAALRLGLRGEARRHLLAARAESPNDPAVALLLADLAPRDQRPDAARFAETIREFEARARKDPGQRGNLARILRAAGHDDRALAVALSTLRDRPGDTTCLAIALMLLPPEDGGRSAALVRAASEAGGDEAAAVLLARRRGRQGEFAAALETIEGRDSPDACLLRAALYRISGREEEGLAALAAVPEEYAVRPDFEQARILLLASAGRVDDALDALADLASRAPGRTDLVLFAADAILVAVEGGRVSTSPGAMEKLLGILSPYPSEEGAFAGLLARANLLLGRTGRAELILDGVRESLAGDPAIRRARIRSFLLDGRIEKAIDLALEDEGALNDRLLLDMADLAVRSGHADRVENLAERAAGGGRTEGWVEVRARVLLRKSRPEEVLSLVPEGVAGRLALIRVRALYAAGRPEAADAALRALPEETSESLGLRAAWRALEGDAEGSARILFDGDAPESVRRGALLVATGHLALVGGEAEKSLLARALDRWPDDPEILGRAALAELRHGPRRAEAQRLRPAVMESSDTGSGSLELARGFYHLADGDPEEAARIASRELVHNPLDRDARLLFAWARARRGEYDEARRQLRGLLEIVPRFSSARTLLSALDVMEAQSRLGEGDPEGAATLLAGSVRGRATSAASLLASARVGLARGDLEEAVRALRTLGMTKDARFLTLAADLDDAISAGDLAAALPISREMVTLRPASPLARLRLGVLALGFGREEEGLGSLREAHRLEPGWTTATAELVRGLVSTGREEEARALVDDALKRDGDDPDALLLAAEMKEASGDREGALAFARRAEELGGGAPARRTLLRLVLSVEGPARGADLAEAWAEEEGAGAAASALAGAAALAGGALDRAERHFQAALEKDDETVAALAGLAEICARRLRYSRAAGYLKEAVHLSPADASLRFFLGAVLQAAGDRGAAIRTYEETLRIDPGHPLALMNLALALAEEGKRIPEALALSERALAGLSGEPEALLVRGRVLTLAGRAEAAVPVLEEAAEKGGGVEARVLLAFALHDSGDRARAKPMLAELVDVPGVPYRKEIESRLERLR